ncbi:multidrug MFS transporter [Eggerthella lenta]|nr:multidrug MFS transporter [Eggerthella lenta]
MPQGVRATRLFVAGGDAKRTRGVTMTPQEPYLAPRACRFDDKRGYVKSSELEASDLAFLAPELTSEAEGPVRAPARADGRWGYRFVKRAFDIAFSLVAIAVLLIPSIVLCAAIRLESPGNPLYSQKRVGRIGRDGQIRTFDMYKFRSMHKDADERLAELADLNEADGPLFKIKDDPRVTRIGKFIRKHSIDELPQFLNCLMGQLSCVGPRPPLPSEVAQYDERAMRRLSVKPGLTGYWQVRGRSDTTFDDMVAMDLAYIEERSFLVDLKVIAKTVVTMLDGKGAC